MDITEFRQHGKEMIDYIADYFETIRERKVYPDVKPNFLTEVLPKEAPMEGHTFENIMKDFDQIIIPGVSIVNFQIRTYCIN